MKYGIQMYSLRDITKEDLDKIQALVEQKNQ